MSKCFTLKRKTKAILFAFLRAFQEETSQFLDRRENVKHLGHKEII